MTAHTIAIVSRAMRTGGSVGAVAWRHALELSRRHRTFVITRDVPPGHHPNIEPVLVDPWRWEWLHRFGHMPAELSFLRAARDALVTLGRRERLDLIWCHSHGLVVWVTPQRERLGRPALVMTTHGDIFDRPRGTYTPGLTWFYRTVTPPAYRQSDLVHVPSPYMGACAVRGGASHDRLRMIPHGVEPAELGADQVGARGAGSFMPDGILRLLFVGNLSDLKGVDVLLHALARLKREIASDTSDTGGPRGYRLLLVGEGPASDRLREHVDRLGLHAEVSFRGRVAREALLAHYRAADLLCVPSRSEAFSLVTLEAMLCGLPVAGSDNGGIPFLVEDGVTGHLARPDDEASLAASIRLASASSAHLAALGARGHAKAREQFAWDHVSPQLDALVREAVHARHGAGR